MHENSIAPYFGPPGTVSIWRLSSGIAIDPFNPDHAMYTSCRGIWITSDLTEQNPAFGGEF